MDVVEQGVSDNVTMQLFDGPWMPYTLIHYGESLALDPVRNFIKVFVGWQVLECFRKDNVSIYYLQDHFDNEKAIDEVIQRVHRFNILKSENLFLIVLL
ncbi:unnamed protein product [Allacma fusca]|uniref:Uncharacterized protein n=1 Tax=Allacma fusca TaxID=39272 RepID=A0A8J2JUN9_9HEXA|nr:unnamed protein product [Allacma fusca]